MDMWVSRLCDWERVGAINQDTEIRRKNRFGGRWYKFGFRVIVLNVSIGHSGGEMQWALVCMDQECRDGLETESSFMQYMNTCPGRMRRRQNTDLWGC